jgi:hypothetical protein
MPARRSDTCNLPQPREGRQGPLRRKRRAKGLTFQHICTAQTDFVDGKDSRRDGYPAARPAKIRAGGAHRGAIAAPLERLPIAVTAEVPRHRPLGRHRAAGEPGSAARADRQLELGLFEGGHLFMVQDPAPSGGWWRFWRGT